VVSEAGIAVDAVVFSVPEVVINNVESFGVFVVSVAGLIIGDEVSCEVVNKSVVSVVGSVATVDVSW
jgi:hypothetical protein